MVNLCLTAQPYVFKASITGQVYEKQNECDAGWCYHVNDSTEWPIASVLHTFNMHMAFFIIYATKTFEYLYGRVFFISNGC